MAGDKVVNFSSGSKYYFEIGSYYYSKNNMDKALFYYQRALAVDPANPVNHFNLACLLSELGKYRESSLILKRVVTEMDSGLSESWFWLAMNYGQLQQYREACHYLRKYLEQEPEGEYSWQAEEILDYMRSDLPMLSPGQREKVDCLCAKGIEMINQGHLQEAIKCFTQASDIEPELTAPLNNLALSWFYLGEMGKAMEMTKEILVKEPGNVFANCNLATFFFIVEDELALQRQIQILDSLWGEDYDEMLKLGTTYGLLGLDRRALNVFRSLFSNGIRTFELMILLGISSHNCGLALEATKIFKRVNEQEPDNPYNIYRTICCKSQQTKLPYHLRVPNEQIAELLENEPDLSLLEEVKNSRELWPQLLWVVRRGNSTARSKLVLAISTMGHQPLLELLIRMAWQPESDAKCRQDILGIIADTGFDVWHRRYWKKSFSANAATVLEQVFADMEQHGQDYAARNRAYMIWMAYCTRKRPRIRNIRLWSAALLVFILGLESLETITVRFGLAPTRVFRAVRQLTGPCSQI